jgi:sugar phosphate isomerase/epimerase
MAAAGASLTLGSLPGAQAASSKVRIGLQLYSLRDQCRTDLPGMLKVVSAAGYKGVEFAGYHGRSASELRKMLDDNGLVACGTHTPYATILEDKLKETVEFNRTIGNTFLIVPSMNASSKKEWQERGKLFNDVAAKVKSEGMFVGYHAHAHDFKKFDGETSWEIFGDNSKSEVILQMDTGNCASGGGDPLAMMKKYPGRTRTIHIKPHGADAEAVIGEDKLDWKQIFAFCESAGGTDWYVIEHETSKDPVSAVKRSFEALKKFGRA